MKNKIKKIRTISEFHRLKNLEKPKHPLISLVDYSQLKDSPEDNDVNWLHNFYSIAIKRNLDVKMMYGQQEYDFDEGLMSFLAPNQVLNVVVEDDTTNSDRSGWLLLFHEDFIWNTTLAKSIGKYDFFDYAVNEALFLSNREEKILETVFQNINGEIDTNIDAYSQNIIITQIELLLNYSERFYNRQFITRKKGNHKILAQLEELLNDYFNSNRLVDNGLPSVQDIAGELHMSPNYLTGLLKSLTGLSTRQHIHQKLIERAKEKLSTTNLTVSEIAYDLGFEHVQSFSKLFKAKTRQSPLEFRASFN
ncbi:helix-turn-helix transcriptional regulator [Muricauda oceani]|uniref:Helix-turn-helix transcriptional regulator n=1 Tax=Flagellimonas oceani TaxID=2698672 RepID=A0A6G7IY78_9FLAO|nr:helix-turn-helix transcriptional regulator [Allomuricauda oceani]MBW8244902.1 helix-turn-helix transcriptional regulator [Allomuricauda oceani]QII43563.1 helix-turn-helix transcriptional regulator [Allomuricauda oceani]